MTKNFRNQRRDDMRPSRRHAASGQNRDEQTTRPAHPRLSRDTVDRAWENGATRTHADYHPRRQPPFSPTQRQGRPAPGFQGSQQSQHYQNRRPDGTSQPTYGARPSAPKPYGYQQHQQPGDRPDNFNRPGYRAPGGQPGLNSERWTRRPAPQQREGYSERSENNRFSNDVPNYRDSRQPQRFSNDAPNYRDSRQPQRFSNDAPNYRDSRQPRSFGQDERNREQFAHGRRTGTPGPRRGNDNPRWQSRPQVQRSYPASRQEYTHEQPGRAQFEGDYEHLTGGEYGETQHSAERRPRPEPTYKRPTTRLPNGRVLKGPRPVQRKQARFWNEVENETSKLVSPVSPSQDAVETVLPQEQGEIPVIQEKLENSVAQEKFAEPVAQEKQKPAGRPKRPQQPGGNKVKSVKTARAASAKPYSAKVARKNARGQQNPVTRPSQRGYHWPAAGE